jgi:hypothetical protein
VSDGSDAVPDDPGIQAGSDPDDGPAADDGIEAIEDVAPVPADRIELPVLAFADGRSSDPRICPFLRLDADGTLIEPVDRFDPSHVCIAFGDPRPQSGRQQELLCLRPSHANCARYLRGIAVPQPAPARAGPPKATVAAVIVLLASIGFSFGFVLQRGGIDLAAFAVPTPSPAGSGGPSPEPSGTTAAVVSPSPVITPEPTISPAPTPSPAATPSPVVTPSPTPPATPSPSPTQTATPAPTSDRYALLEPCPNRPDCWIYTVRSGDNLFSIANYFGHPLETVYRLNPWARTQGIRKGDQLILPPPTR